MTYRTSLALFFATILATLIVVAFLWNSPPPF
jgi:hypothetical protein